MNRPMGKTEPNRLSATEAARRIADGSLTVEALVRASLERIMAREPAVHAWAHLDPEAAIAAARAADARAARGWLHGLPVGIKDVIETADQPTGHGSPIYDGHRPRGDAASVARIRAVGGIIMGKTVTTELANRFPGATANPHNPAHTPGGSSSGSAAAVADFHVPFALGTQTGGSVVRPAAYCGVIGYKPTFGDLSRVGLKLQSHSLDTIGIIARTLEDTALLRAGVLGLAPEPVDREAAAPRIGLFRTTAWAYADEATHALIEGTATRLSTAGAVVREVTVPPEFANKRIVHRRIHTFEAARNYAHELICHRDRLSPVLVETVLEPGLKITAEEYAAALEAAERWRAWLDDVFTDVDVLLTPSTPGEAPEGLGSTGDPMFNSPWTMAWTPCLTLPAGTGPKGLPLGVQLVAARYEDRALLDAAAWVERRVG